MGNECRVTAQSEDRKRRSTVAARPKPPPPSDAPPRGRRADTHATAMLLPQSIDYLDVARSMTCRIITNDADKVNTMQAFGGAGRPRQATGHHLLLSASVDIFQEIIGRYDIYRYGQISARYDTQPINRDTTIEQHHKCMACDTNR